MSSTELASVTPESTLMGDSGFSNGPNKTRQRLSAILIAPLRALLSHRATNRCHRSIEVSETSAAKDGFKVNAARTPGRFLRLASAVFSAKDVNLTSLFAVAFP